MVKKQRMCKKVNMDVAMVIGVSIMKDIEKKSFEKTAFDLHLPFGDFNCIIVRNPTADNSRLKKERVLDKKESRSYL